MPCWTTTNLLFCCSFSLWQATCSMYDKATGMSFSCRCGLFGIWWGETWCAPNSLEFDSCYMPIGARLDHGPGAGNNRTTFRKLGTESCCLTNCFGFFVCHQLVPHLVPNFPRVPLRNVSWGLGVCAVLVRSVSPCRFVPEVRLFPSPPALFLAVCPSCVRFFLPLAFQGWPGSGRVCVCNI